MQAYCQHCHTPIPPDSPSGSCPACLIALADVPTDDKMLPETPLTPAELAGRVPGIEFAKLIGRGGMGAVYQGFQTDLNRQVAVKILPQSLSSDPVFVQRFRREAEALARLDHRNIVTVFGSGVCDGLCYIVMEYVEGTTLRDAMSAAAVDPAAALQIVPQICDALAYAHQRGVVHRDIKPENILLGVGGKVKVVDFGLAKMSDDDRTHSMLTATGTRMGTLRYMAPEQLDGTTVDHRADVYSLGVVFYEMLTGQIPMGQFAMPSEKSAVDPRIDDVVMRTLCREPSERYQNISDVEQELQSISDRPASLGWRNQPSMPVGREWKSRATLFGLPIVHIAFGHNPRTKQKLIAKGIIAVGDVAVGGLAVGGTSIGVISMGGVALGVNALGGVAGGLQVAFGGVAFGGIAVGGIALALAAFGGGAFGMLAFGGAATGYVVGGGKCYGTYVLDRAGNWSPPEFADSPFVAALSSDWMPLVASCAVVVVMMGPVLLVGAAACIGWLRSQRRGVIEQPIPGEAKRQLQSALVSCLVVSFIFAAAIAVQGSTFYRFLVPETPPASQVENVFPAKQDDQSSTD